MARPKSDKTVRVEQAVEIERLRGSIQELHRSLKERDEEAEYHIGYLRRISVLMANKGGEKETTRLLLRWNSDPEID